MRIAKSRRRLVPAAFVLCGALVAAAADTRPAPPSFAPNHAFVGGRDRTTLHAAVFEFDESGAFVRQIEPDGGAADEIYGVAFGPDGALYVAANMTSRIVRIDASLATSVFADAADGVSSPVGVTFGPGGRLYVANRVSGGTVLAFDAKGDVVDTYTAPTGKSPAWVTFGPEGHAYVVTSAAAGATVEELDADLDPVRTLGAGRFAEHAGNAVFARDGSMYVPDFYRHQLNRFGPDGENEGGLAVENLKATLGAALGPDGNLYVADDDRHVVVVADARTGASLRELTAPSLVAPSGIAFAPFRFWARIKGTLVRQNGAAKRFGDPTAVVSVTPGSGAVLVAVSDLAAKDDVPDVFPATAALVLHGAEVESADARTWLFHGVSVAGDPTTDGVASIEALAKGSASVGGMFAPKSLSGSLHLSRSGAALMATFETTHRIP